jgi:hypothetical protein
MVADAKLFRGLIALLLGALVGAITDLVLWDIVRLCLLGALLLAHHTVHFPSRGWAPSEDPQRARRRGLHLRFHESVKFGLLAAVLLFWIASIVNPKAPEWWDTFAAEEVQRVYDSRVPLTHVHVLPDGVQHESSLTEVGVTGRDSLFLMSSIYVARKASEGLQGFARNGVETLFVVLLVLLWVVRGQEFAASARWGFASEQPPH